MVYCPECGSANVRQIIPDGDEFICGDCGEQFEADTDELEEEDD